MELDVRLKKTIGNFTLDCTFSLSASRAGVFGPSGSGKSTLMHLLAGLATADHGSIRLDDQVLFDTNSNTNKKPEERRIGVVFQHAHLFPHMSVRKNILYGYARTAREERKIEPEGLFRVLGVDTLEDRDVTTLSGGERQRVALARTLLTCPRLILMDEPLSGLDEERKFQIIPYLERVFGEYAIPLIFISHSLLEMRMMTDEVLVMEKGSITRQLATESFARTTWDTGRKAMPTLLLLGLRSRTTIFFPTPGATTALF